MREKTDENNYYKVFEKNGIRVKAHIEKDQDFYFLGYKYLDKVEGIRIARRKQYFDYLRRLDDVKQYAEHFFYNYFEC